MEELRELKAKLDDAKKECKEVDSLKEKLAISEQANRILKTEVRQ